MRQLSIMREKRMTTSEMGLTDSSSTGFTIVIKWNVIVYALGREKRLF